LVISTSQKWVTWWPQLSGNLGRWVFVTGHIATLNKIMRFCSSEKNEEWIMSGGTSNVCHILPHVLQVVIFVLRHMLHLLKKSCRKWDVVDCKKPKIAINSSDFCINNLFPCNFDTPSGSVSQAECAGTCLEF
jgi:hypothetical protein